MPRQNKRHFSEAQANVIYSVFGELSNLTNSELRRLFGSDGAIEVVKLAGELRYYDYCKRNGIKYSEMTAEDFERAYFDVWGS